MMKAMEDEDPARGLHGDTGGRHTRALAKRCIVLTEENRVRLSRHPPNTVQRVLVLPKEKQAWHRSYGPLLHEFWHSRGGFECMPR